PDVPGRAEQPSHTHPGPERANRAGRDAAAEPGAAVSELAWLTASELGRRIARRKVSPVEAVDDAIGRIECIDGQINAFVTRTFEQGRAGARAGEAEIAAGGARGPFYGVPMALKDIFDTAGVETAAGSKIMKGNVPERDAAVVARLRAAGAILLGK